MKRQLFALMGLFLLCGTPALSQNQVLAQSQGYQLTEQDLVPGIQFLNFLIQGQVTQQELQYLVQSSVQEFQANPVEFLTQLRGLNQSIGMAQGITDPLKLGEFRYTVIGEFYSAAQNMPANQMPAMLQVLFKRVPVVAFDPRSKVALTQFDLQASMLYMGELYTYQGHQVTEQQLVQLGNQLAQNFSQLDKQTQQFLASGAVVLNIFRANMAQMNQQQQQAMAQAYQQQAQAQAYQQPQYSSGNSGGSTSVQAKQWENWHNQQSFNIMQETMNQNHVTMMNVIENMGGSDNYWTLEPTTY